MKTHVLYSFVLLLMMLSPNCFSQGWVIPGGDCRPAMHMEEIKWASENDVSDIRYSYSGLTNNSSNKLSVICSSHIINNFGDKLDVDIFVVNNSSSYKLECEAFVADEEGAVITETETASVGQTPASGASMAIRHSHAARVGSEGVVVGVNCRIPPKQPNKSPSSIISIKFH